MRIKQLTYNPRADVLPWFNGKDYGYDANGNLTHDRDRNITAIAYNAVDRPQSVRFANGDVTRYVYSATGERLAEVHASRDGLSDVRRMRLGAFSFTDGRLERTELPQGYLDTLGTLHAYILDFQGNIVGVYREGGGLEQFTDYYPYGTPHPDARHPEANRRKYGGKELLTEGGLNEHDFEARRLTPLGSFSQPDPLAGTLTDPETGDRLPVPYLCHISPYAYCAADPINSIDPTGERVYMLFYTEGNKESGADDMFKAAAETRKQDIESSTDFDSQKDIVVLTPIKDIAALSKEVSRIASQYSGTYGKTIEFGIWSHSALDGPKGTVAASSDGIGSNQMSLEGWSKIDFNWDTGASAYFYGCRSGAAWDRANSFTTRLSACPNLSDVAVYGQTSYSYPSQYANYRIPSVFWSITKYPYPIYMVGDSKNNTFNAFTGGVVAKPMRRSVNGRGEVGFMQPGRKY